MLLHVLHIGKTGGTSLSNILKSKKKEIEASPFTVVRYQHDSNIRNIRTNSEEGKFIFFVRHPVSRFISGFHSRQRMGRPAYNIPWTSSEQAAFEMFKDPEALAAGLDSDDQATRTAAFLSMKVIEHVRDPMTFWLGSPKRLRRHAEEIFFIGAQETFNDDSAALLRKMGVDSGVPALSESEKHAAERKPFALSERAAKNIETWYSDDLEIYKWCMRNRERINTAGVSEMGKLHAAPKSADNAKTIARRKKIIGAAKKAAKAAGQDWTKLTKEERKPFRVAAKTAIKSARKRQKAKRLAALANK